MGQVHPLKLLEVGIKDYVDDLSKGIHQNMPKAHKSEGVLTSFQKAEDKLFWWYFMFTQGAKWITF